MRVSSRLRERYPEQMTIVLQFQYWDLKVTETGFEVGLSFSDVPEKLEVPFAAVRGFYDPSVNFELEFDVKPETRRAAAGRERRRERKPEPPAAKAPAAGEEIRAAHKAEAGAKPVAAGAPTTARRAPTSSRSTLSARSSRPMAEIVNLRQVAQAEGARRRCRAGRRRRTARCSAAARPKSSATAREREGARRASSTAIAATTAGPTSVSYVVKRSVTIRGHRTSFSLEQPFFEALVAIASAPRDVARRAGRRGRRQPAERTRTSPRR